MYLIVHLYVVDLARAGGSSRDEKLYSSRRGITLS
jgi:hypothetical protein